MQRLARLAILAAALTIATPWSSLAQAVIKGVVLDQTGLPLPGATVQLVADDITVASVTTAGDGTFEIEHARSGATLVVSLSGFETVRARREDAARIVLPIGRATESTTVVASTIEPSLPTTALLGNKLTADTVARLPSAKFKAKESLPLLPSVVRGPDGLLQLGGARAHDTPLVLDGFNITDPATGTSSINLPFEAVRGVSVLRDPMSITYGGLLGGMIQMESRPGGDKLELGVQGFAPRPRFANPGFGRLEGIFPRAFFGGKMAGGRMRHFTAIEYDFERIPVPGVTQGAGPDVVDEMTTFFSRVDFQATPHHLMTLEALVFPARTGLLGLSPRRAEEATADIRSKDVFAGFTDRFVVDKAGVFSIHLGVFLKDATLSPNGEGAALLSPDGWHGNWFSSVQRHSSRYSVAATWERIASIGSKNHDITFSGEIATRRLRTNVAEQPVLISDGRGRRVRTIEFGAPADIRVRDLPVGLALRDVWDFNQRTQIDMGVRADHSRHGGVAPSARAGVRYSLDESGLTVLKAGYGSFVGNLPLAVEAFGSYPVRTDRRFDVDTGSLLSEGTLTPTATRLRLPQALAATIGIERQIFQGLDAQVSATSRQSMRLATLRVPERGGPLAIESTGSGQYREVQFSARRNWEGSQQLFVSYVRSSAVGELNNFAALFQAFDSPLLQPGGRARLASDARHRVLAWGTFNLPRRVVVSPVLEWHSGFVYSALNEWYLHEGTPNSKPFPAFISTDMVIYKTFTVRNRSADFGVQIFNATNHFNPRDVYSVAGSLHAGAFANSVGTILRGYMLLKW